MADKFVLVFDQVTKRFGDVVANDAVSFSVVPGEVHALIGENGAGKTTLVNILFGMLVADEGKIFWRGKKLCLTGPHSAVKQGLGMVQQEICLAEALTAAQNIIAGAEKTRGLDWISWRRVEEEVDKLLEEFECRFSSQAVVADLSLVQQRIVEILRLLWHQAELVILDEPTSRLGPKEIDLLLGTLSKLRERGVTVLFITHRLEEIFTVADRVSVLRRGRLVATLPIKETNEQELGRLMFGQRNSLSEKHRSLPRQRGKVIAKMHFDGFALKDCNFKIYEGERLGIAALPGNGGEELVAAFSGSLKWQGNLELMVRKGTGWRKLSSIKAQRRWGIRVVPAQRLGLSLAPFFTIVENGGIGWLSSFVQRFAGISFISYKKLTEVASKLPERFGIKMKHPEQMLKTLSGGNQQRFQIGRELTANPRILIMEHPTQGIDLAGVSEFRNWFDSYLGDPSHNLQAVFIVSPDLEELLGLCDRLLVMYRGQIVYETGVDAIDEEEWNKIGRMLTGGKTISSLERSDGNAATS